MFDRMRDERGVALILTVLLALMVAGMAVGIILMMGNANLIAKFQANEAMMEMAADAGLEKGRDTLNGTPGIVPVGLGFVTLENNVQVRDASGAVIPGFTRSLYAGEPAPPAAGADRDPQRARCGRGASLPAQAGLVQQVRPVLQHLELLRLG